MRRVALSAVAIAIAALSALPTEVAAQGPGTYVVANFMADLAAAEAAPVVAGNTRQAARADGWRLYLENGGTLNDLVWKTPIPGKSVPAFHYGGGSGGGVSANTRYDPDITNFITNNDRCPWVHPMLDGPIVGIEYILQQTFSQPLTFQAVSSHYDCANGGNTLTFNSHLTSAFATFENVAGASKTETLGQGCNTNPVYSSYSYTAPTGRPAGSGIKVALNKDGDYNHDSTYTQIIIWASCSDACTSSYCATEFDRTCTQGLTPDVTVDQCLPHSTGAPTTPTTTATTTTTTTTPPPATPACDCAAEKLTVSYDSDAIPDATADAISNISLDTDTWEVVFEVRNVKAISNGHVIAAAVNTQETAANAFTPLVSAFDANDLWNPLECGLGGIDTPAASLKVRTEWDNAACRTKYEMRYSLISAVDRDDHYCDLTDDNAGNIKVNCSIVLSSVRAYSSTETWAFVAQEAAFAAELNLGTYLNNEVTDLLHATMAKCSVKNGPLYVVDCRVPGVWNFDQGAFSVAQSPAGWINAASCASNVVGSDAATAATFIRCNIENDAPIANVERALANITGTPVGNPTNALTFDVDFIVPRKVTTTASASLASFVQTIEMKDGRYYYGTADVATLEITVVDTARLSMTALELFNSATPDKQVYDIFPGTSDARFQTALNADATKFTIDFYPAAIREDSAFYRYGPHGINVSFTFSAARRVTGGGVGNVLVEGLNVEGTEASTSSGAQGSAASSSSGTALMAGVAVGAAVLVAGLVGAAAVVIKRRSAQEKEQL